jgi:hypothetical protein
MTEAERYRFDVMGYLVRRGALSDDEVAAALEACSIADRPVPGADLMSQRFSGYLDRHPAFRHLIDHPAVFDIVREVCGQNVRLDHTYGIQMVAGTSGLGLHGGGAPFDPAQYAISRDGRMHHGLVAVMWALVDHPFGTGFRCVPGSHHASFPLPHGVDDLVVSVALRPGDVVVFSEALTHGTLPWTEEHDRLALLYKYAPGHLCWSEYTGWSDAIRQGCTPRQRLLLQPPSVGRHQPVV